MFKNKRNFSIIAIVLIAIIGLIYVGCSKSADMQTTPKDKSNIISLQCEEEFEIVSSEKKLPKIFKICKMAEKSYIISGEVIKSNEGNIKIVFPECSEINLPSYKISQSEDDISTIYIKDVIERLIHLFKVGYFTSEKRKSGKVFINNLNAILYMVDAGNYKGAMEKIENNIIPAGDHWISGWLKKNYFKQLCFITIEMLEHPGDSYYIVQRSLWPHLVFHLLVEVAAHLLKYDIECEFCKMNCADYASDEDGNNSCLNDVCWDEKEGTCSHIF